MFEFSFVVVLLNLLGCGRVLCHQLPATLLFMSLRLVADEEEEEAPAANAANFSRFSRTPGEVADDVAPDILPAAAAAAAEALLPATRPW